MTDGDTQYVQFRGSRADALRLIRLLPLILTGQVTDQFRLTRLVLLRVGNAFLSQVRQAFILKSRGETGTDGITWPKLKRETVAYGRRTTKAERRRLGIRDRGARPTLTPELDRLWRVTFARVLQRSRMDLGDAGAKRKAAAVAWAVVKAAGAKTKLDLLGDREVDILRDTGELLRSLSAGVDDQPSGADGQVFEVRRSSIVVGTNKKPWHHTGDPDRGLPARPFWPPDETIPPRWEAAIEAATVRGIRAVTKYLMGAAT